MGMERFCSFISSFFFFFFSFLFFSFLIFKERRLEESSSLSEMTSVLKKKQPHFRVKPLRMMKMTSVMMMMDVKL